MIVTYTFDTENQQDREDLKNFQRADQMYNVLFQVSNNLYRELENDLEEHDYSAQDMLDKTFEDINKLITEKNLSI